ncbi:hypothetical protein LPJ53_005744 [Coemansia erecta]|uniref:WD40 repeat-like protein n=1 Tax=Coemansia erecta TaxID=147472 RepID=A0A9W7XVM3_9FUNG|nr:hypothetical protein LPJ53_005744 [Coemansia erecta]
MSVDEESEGSVEEIVEVEGVVDARRRAASRRRHIALQELRTPTARHILAQQRRQQTAIHIPTRAEILQVARHVIRRIYRPFTRRRTHRAQSAAAGGDGSAGAGPSSGPVGDVPAVRNELRCMPWGYRLSDLTTVRCVIPGLQSHRALVHQFGGLDSQTVVAYGNNMVQIWNPVDQTMDGQWSGAQEGFCIEQVKPVSPSVLAVVSAGGGAVERAARGGRLLFLSPRWSARQEEFTAMPVKQWTHDARSSADIAVVEEVQSGGSSNRNPISLFTGAMAGGTIYRRVLDVSRRTAKMLGEQEIYTPYRQPVTALCHVEARGTVISGNIAGSVSLSNHKRDTSLKSFSLGKGNAVSSIVRCPFNLDLFMATGRKSSRIVVFDSRMDSRSAPSLVLEDAASLPPLGYNHPAWHSESGLICAPARRGAAGMETALVNVWDPRYIDCRAATQFIIHEDDRNATSVDFTEASGNGGPLMVTASGDALVFTSFTIGRL